MVQDPNYLQKLLRDAQASYSDQNMISRSLHEKSVDYLPGGNTRTVLYTPPFPLTIESGHCGTVTTVDGQTYIDFLNEYSAGVYGHSNVRIAEAVQEAMKKGWNLGGHSTYEKILARKVVQRFSASGLNLVRFTNSGTEANMMCIAAAVAHTGRKKILVFSSGYHGGTFIFPMGLMMSPTFLSSNVPYDFIYAPFNNISETKKSMSTIPPESLAAILVEPVQGSGGCRPASLPFLHYLRALADRERAVLIFDEVMTSRLGPHGYIAAKGMKGDLVSLGKYVGGGMTFGAFGGRRDIMSLFDPASSKLQHPGTYNNNIVTMAAGIQGLDLYNAAEVERLNNLGTQLKCGLQAILIKYNIYPLHHAGVDRSIIEADSFEGPTTALVDPGSEDDKREPLPRMFVTGYGSMLNIRFSGPDAANWQPLFFHHMLDKRIYLASRGYVTLSMETTLEHLNHFLSATAEFVSLHRSAILGQLLVKI